MPGFWRRALPSTRIAIAGLYAFGSLLQVVVILFHWNRFDRDIAFGILMVLGYWATFLAPVLAPALVAGAIAGERERRTWEALVLSRLSAAEIIWGKLLSRVMPIVWVTLFLLPTAIVLLIHSGGHNPFSSFPGGGMMMGGRLPWGNMWIWVPVTWITGHMIVFANAVMTLYVSFRSANTRSAMLVSYGIATGAYIFLTMLIGALMMVVMIPFFMSTFGSAMSSGGSMPNPSQIFPPGLTLLTMILSMLPTLLWGVLIPAIFLPILLTKFGQLNARVGM